MLKGKILKEHAKILKKELTEMGLYPKIRINDEKGWENIDLKVFYSRFMADVDMDWIFGVLHNLGYHKEIWFTFLPSKAGVWLHIVVSASRWGQKMSNFPPHPSSFLFVNVFYYFIFFNFCLQYSLQKVVFHANENDKYI